MTDPHDRLPRTTDLPRLPERSLRALRPAGRRFIAARWRLRTLGDDLVPRVGPVILAANHTGWLDGPLLAAVAPRPVHAMVKKEMFVGRTGRLLTATGQIEVDRAVRDPHAVRAAVRSLRDGQAVAMFPESTRGAGELVRIRGGCAYLALVTGAPIVPVAIFGTRSPGASVSSRPAPGSRIDVVYGARLTFDPTPWPRTRAAVVSASGTLQAHLVEHLHAARRTTGATLPGDPPDADLEGLD